jgi:enoyl-CoA hydratase
VSMSTEMSGHVRLQLADGIAVLTVDNPPLNLLTMAVREQLARHADQLRENPDCRAVVIVGSGERAFSAGSDVREFPTDAAAGTARARAEHDWFAALESLPQPTVAALEGHVLGGGLELALCTDLRVAGRTARLGTPEVTLGLLPCGGATQRLPRLVGRSRAKQLLLLGERIGAEQALRIGLVDEVVDEGQAKRVALSMAGRLAAASPGAVQAIKRAVDLGLDEGVDSGMRLEEELVGPLFASDDARAAVAALIHRR